MATSPYRTPAQSVPPGASPAPPSTAAVAAFVWLMTIVRLGISFARPEPLSRELALAWIVLFVTPLLVRREITDWWRAR